MKNRNLKNTFIKAASVYRSGFMFLGFALLVMVLSVPNTIKAQNPSSFIYHKDSLKADLLDLRETLYESHQNPFFYVDSLDFEKAFSQSYDGITEDISLADFSAIVGNLLQRIKDSHTVVSYRSLFNFLRADTTLNLYFSTSLIEDKLVITKDYLGIIPKGAVLISVNNISTSQLLSDLLPYQFLEGNSDVQSLKLVSGLTSRIIAMKYGVLETNSIKYLLDSKEYSIGYPGTPYKKIKKDKDNKPVNPFRLQIKDSIATLKITSFSAKSELYYERFLQRSFRKIRNQKCTHLIIDLRNNLGGSVWRMEELFTYLNGPDIITPYSMMTTKSKLSTKKYDLLTRGFTGWSRLHLFKKNDKMRVFRELATLPINTSDTVIYKESSSKKRNLFEGTCSLFTNHASGSASVLFASAFRTNGYGLILGSPCLGPIGGTWGDPTPYVLPRSFLQVNISVLKLNTSSDYSSNPESILPDLPYTLLLEDIQSENDALYHFYLENMNRFTQR